MGGRVYERSKGNYYIEYTYNGRRVSRKVPGKVAGLSLLKRLDDEFSEKAQIPTFEDISNIWLNSAKRLCKPSTISDYEAILNNHIYDNFGNIEINKITRKKIRNFLISKIDKGFSISTVKHMRAVFSNVFCAAIDEEIIETNPAANITNIFNKKKKKIFYLNGDQVTAILKHALEMFPDDYPLFLLLARTGLRFGEALALKWEDINFEKREMYIQRSIVRKIIGTPKSHDSRIVHISQNLSDVLIEKKRSSEWLFPGKKNTSKPLDGDSWRKRKFKAVILNAGLPEETRIHDLRHAYASMMIQNGENMKYISQQMGHHSIKITMDTYGHLVNSDDRSAVDRLD